MRADSGGEPAIDLHGLRVAQAVSQTNAFLLREQARGSVAVRIITGHGTGALKTAIRALLSNHPAVSSSMPALASDAATLVVLSPPLRGDSRRKRLSPGSAGSTA